MEKNKKKVKLQPKLQAIINENDIEIMKAFKNQPFTVVDLIKRFNFSFTEAYRRIARLKKAKVIERINPGISPAAFNIIKYIETPVFVNPNES